MMVTDFRFPWMLRPSLEAIHLKYKVKKRGLCCSYGNNPSSGFKKKIRIYKHSFPRKNYSDVNISRYLKCETLKGNNSPGRFKKEKKRFSDPEQPLFFPI